MNRGSRANGSAFRVLTKWLPWLFIGIAVVLATILGYLGFTKHAALHGESLSVSDTLYLCIQLFTMESGAASPPVPWELDTARWLAPLVSIWAILRTLAAIFREKLQMLGVRWWRGHVIVCGLGRKGLALVKGCRARGLKVVAIESNEGNDAVHTCREMGVPVILGDATDEILLARVRPSRASTVCVVAGIDGTNVEIAIAAARNAGRESLASRQVTCCVHVVDLGLCSLFNTHRIFEDNDHAPSLRVFNIYDTAARTLLQQHPLEAACGAVDTVRRPKLLVIGFGRMGAAVALQAAKTAHYADAHPLRMLVVDADALRLRERFLGNFAQFDKVCDVEFLEGDIESAEVMNRVRNEITHPDFRTTVAVCFDDDARSMMAGLRLSSSIGDTGVPIMVRMAETLGLATLMEKKQTDVWLERIHPFGMIADACTVESLLETEVDTLAKAIHDAYRNEVLKEGLADREPSMVDWDRLDPALKDSNRQQADHIPVKLRAIGCSIAPADAPGQRVLQFEAEEIEALAHMEHRRWCAERMLAGWTSGPKNAGLRTTPYLVPWENLDESVKNYDRNSVRRIPEFLQSIKLGIFRISNGSFQSHRLPASRG